MSRDMVPAVQVSIVMPCRNEEAFIGPCLDSIALSDYPKTDLEVLGRRWHEPGWHESDHRRVHTPIRVGEAHRQPERHYPGSYEFGYLGRAWRRPS